MVTRHLAQMIHPTVLVTRHQRNVPDGLEVSPLAAVSRHTAHVLGTVLMLKAMLQLCVAEADANTEVNNAEVTIYYLGFKEKKKGGEN